MTLDHATLEAMRRQHPAWRLLVAESAPLVARTQLPRAHSFLMDRATLMAHRSQWLEEPQAVLRDLPRLDSEERALFDDLRWKRLGDRQIRLEQERIGFGWIAQALRSRFVMGQD